MNASRPWLVFVLALFCLPLFVGLGRGDLLTDEAIYSFGVDRILESGDWLAPKSSPHDEKVFLEKPPLKFWMVAAPIRWGLLPHDEFGLRFWDAVCGSLTLLYVCAIGYRLAGYMCGISAALILFVHQPLVFDHGFRSNNMEAALVLCYCGAVYHYLRWGSNEADGPRGGHAIAVGLYFALGFMTKFAAAFFLPLVLGLAGLTAGPYRAGLRRDWRMWTSVSALVVALVAPWFLYALYRFGAEVWRKMVAEAIYTRFTLYLNPEHVQPWHYYFTQAYAELSRSHSAYLVIAGGVLLLAETIRRRWSEGLVIVLWLAVPATAISFGVSKIYHYFYPFLPPLALGGGYLAAVLLALAKPPVDRALGIVDSFLTRRAPKMLAAFERPPIRALLLGVAVGAIAVGVWNVRYGGGRINLGPFGIVKSNGLFRPALVALVCGVLGRAATVVGGVLVPLLLAVTVLPSAAYSGAVSQLDADRHRTRSVRNCLLRVEAQAAGTNPPGLYVDLPDSLLLHPLNYYFRRVRPWTRAHTDAFSPLYTRLFTPGEQQPALVSAERYEEFTRRLDGVSPLPGPGGQVMPMVLFDRVVLLLPGPYGPCVFEGHGAD